MKFRKNQLFWINLEVFEKKFRRNLDELRRNLVEIQMNFRQNLEEIQEFRQKLEIKKTIRIILTKFR